MVNDIYRCWTSVYVLQNIIKQGPLPLRRGWDLARSLSLEARIIITAIGSSLSFNCRSGSYKCNCSGSMLIRGGSRISLWRNVVPFGSVLDMVTHSHLES